VKIFQLLYYFKSIEWNKLPKRWYKYNKHAYIHYLYFCLVNDSNSSIKMLNKKFSLLSLFLIFILLINIAHSQSVSSTEYTDTTEDVYTTTMTGNTVQTSSPSTTTTTNSSPRSLLAENKS
jgi:hypothetical protein